MENHHEDTYNFGEKIFKARDYTPIPLIVLIFLLAEPSVRSAVIGMILILSGEIVRLYSVAFIGSISRTRKNRTGGELIRSGPFSFVRNPLYVGNFFISVGVATFAGNFYATAITALLFAFQYYHIVKYEESWLKQNFGEEYDVFCKEVPAWFPQKSIKLDSLEWPETFSPAIKSERKTLLAIAAMVSILTIIA
tara:strand:- start:23 stop:604 length:582 start_codon:yes stop_codon:yes gene_type:complete